MWWRLASVVVWAAVPGPFRAQAGEHSAYFMAGGKGGPSYGGYYPRTLEYDAETLAKARDLAAGNRLRLAALRQRLREDAEAELCGAPPVPRGDRLVRWLHVPKCGSTFINTILKYGCDALAERRGGNNLSPKRRPDVYLGAPTPADMRPLAAKLASKNNDGSVIHERLLAAFAQEQCSGQGTQHRFELDKRLGPVAQALKTGGPAVKLAILQWASHGVLMPSRSGQVVAQNEKVVAIFRSPEQRVISAYNFGLHLWGSEMRNQNGTIGSEHFARWRSWIQGGASKAETAADFAGRPGIGGCMAKMLSGCFCATRPAAVQKDGAPMRFPAQVACPYQWRSLDEKFAERAAARVAHMGFVGIQDLYNSSVCLFHRIYGGRADPSEFSFFNVGNHRGARRPEKYTLEKHGAAAKLTTEWDRADLGGDHLDYVDEIVWRAVLDRFTRDLDAALDRIRAPP